VKASRILGDIAMVASIFIFGGLVGLVVAYYLGAV
jgi:hypothetical protein